MILVKMFSSSNFFEKSKTFLLLSDWKISRKKKKRKTQSKAWNQKRRRLWRYEILNESDVEGFFWHLRHNPTSMRYSIWTKNSRQVLWTQTKLRKKVLSLNVLKLTRIRRKQLRQKMVTMKGKNFDNVSFFCSMLGLAPFEKKIFVRNHKTD